MARKYGLRDVPAKVAFGDEPGQEQQGQEKPVPASSQVQGLQESLSLLKYPLEASKEKMRLNRAKENKQGAASITTLNSTSASEIERVLRAMIDENSRRQVVLEAQTPEAFMRKYVKAKSDQGDFILLLGSKTANASEFKGMLSSYNALTGSSIHFSEAQIRGALQNEGAYSASGHALLYWNGGLAVFDTQVHLDKQAEKNLADPAISSFRLTDRNGTAYTVRRETSGGKTAIKLIDGGNVQDILDIVRKTKGEAFYTRFLLLLASATQKLESAGVSGNLVSAFRKNEDITESLLLMLGLFSIQHDLPTASMALDAGIRNAKEIARQNGRPPTTGDVTDFLTTLISCDNLVKDRKFLERAISDYLSAASSGQGVGCAGFLISLDLFGKDAMADGNMGEFSAISKKLIGYGRVCEELQGGISNMGYLALTSSQAKAVLRGAPSSETLNNSLDFFKGALKGMHTGGERDFFHFFDQFTNSEKAQGAGSGMLQRIEKLHRYYGIVQFSWLQKAPGDFSLIDDLIANFEDRSRHSDRQFCVVTMPREGSGGAFLDAFAQESFYQTLCDLAKNTKLAVFSVASVEDMDNATQFALQHEGRASIDLYFPGGHGCYGLIDGKKNVQIGLGDSPFAPKEKGEPMPSQWIMEKGQQTYGGIQLRNPSEYKVNPPIDKRDLTLDTQEEKDQRIMAGIGSRVKTIVGFSCFFGFRNMPESFVNVWGGVAPNSTIIGPDNSFSEMKVAFDKNGKISIDYSAGIPVNTIIRQPKKDAAKIR